jgi:hypothetical protein
MDPKLYMFIILQMALITAQSFNNFFPSIVGTLGYNETVTLLLTAPPYAFAFICSLALSFHAAKKQERGFHIAVPLLFALIGNVLVRVVISAIFSCLKYCILTSHSRQCSFQVRVEGTSACF